MSDTQLGRYRLLERLGHGGMAEVFLAETTGPGDFQKVVALKRILPHLAEDPEFVTLFLNEARLAARLSHPNIVQLFDLGEADGSYFVAMEYIDGPSLRGLCARATQRKVHIPPSIAARIISDACEGLAYAHDYSEDGQVMQLVHRDVSPDNVLVTRTGNVKIADFGIAKPANRRETRAGIIRGKVWYMPPEQLCDEQLDRRVDVFALGVVFYELLTGVLPFEATNETAAIRAILETPFLPLSVRRDDCPPELWAVLSRALEKDAADRYPDCHAFHLELERYLVARGEVVTSKDVAAFIAGLFSDLPEGALSDRKLARNTIPARPRASAARCPACSSPMELAHAGGIVADGCRTCGGIWLDKGEMQHLGNRPGALLEVAKKFSPQGEWDLTPHDRTCPRCRTKLTPFEFPSLKGIQLDQCELCGGLWLDHSEPEAIEARLHADHPEDG